MELEIICWLLIAGILVDVGRDSWRRTGSKKA